MIWTFENYELDSENAILSRDGEAVELRPKTFDVLHYLVEHAGELVRKETLLEAVWKNSYVVEGVLSTSMSELRKLFGDTAKNQRYIATVYRRGYRFIAPVNEKNSVVESIDSNTPIVSVTGSNPGSVSRFPPYGSLIGRENESERLVAQLTEDSDCRILTLVGPGGIGKSHLAVMVARQIAKSDDHPFADGFYFVHLQSSENPDDLSSIILEALDLQSSSEQSPQQHLQSYLGDKRILLVIDNFEYYLDLQSTLTELISAAPSIKILLTSRESLHISDAWFHPVTGLQLNNSIDSDAVRLFIHLAQRAQPEFDIEEKLPVVLRICELIEGMPLAMELAVGWMRMLSLDEVANEIEQNLDILARQQGEEGGRHGSMRAVFNETWARLTESERTLMKQLSVFRGGSDRDAIRAAIGAGLPILARLVNKALIYTTRDNRYYMHELIRQFAEDELSRDQAIELEARNQHARFYLGHVENQFERLCGEQQGEACQAIQDESDNIRTAWYWAISQQQFDLLQGSIRIIFYYCELRGHFRDGLAMLEAAQAAIEATDHSQKKLLVGGIKMRAGVLNFFLSRYDKALALFDEVRQIPELEFEQTYVLRFLGDYHFNHAGYFTAEESKQYLEACIDLNAGFEKTHTSIECLGQLAFFYTNLVVDIKLSHQYALDAVQMARKLGTPDILAYALHVLAWTLNHRGDYAQAETVWREALGIASRVGHRRYIALITNWLGWSAWSVGEARLEEAYVLFSLALEMHQELGDRDYASMCYADLATVKMEQGEFDEAREFCLSGLELAEKIGRDDHHVYNLFVLGAVECADGNLEQAHTHLIEALQLAWRYEEQTNRVMVVYYLAQLMYAEYRNGPDNPEALGNIITLLRFLQIYPTTWQAFRDRAKRFEESIMAEHGAQVFTASVKLSDKKITDKALKLINRILKASGN